MEPYMDFDTPYTNERLVVAAARNPAFLAIKSPRDPHVLDAMRRVDRRDFLPDWPPMEFEFIDMEALDQMRVAYERLNALKNTRLVYPNREQELVQLSLTFSESLTQLLAESQSYRFVISPASLAYNDCTVPILCDQKCSKPSLVAFMNDILGIHEGQNILEIGTGCGYHAAITLEQLGENGKLTTVETKSELADLGRRNLAKYGGRVCVINGDGKEGYEQNAPYDRIYITAGVKIDEFNPEVFLDQLKREDGAFLFPEEHGFHLMGYKSGNRFENFYPLTLSFVPLV